MKKKIIITILSIILLLIIVNTFFIRVIDIDTSFYNGFVKKIINKKNTNIFKIITDFGGAILLILISIVLVIIFRKNKLVKYIPINLATIFLLNFLLKLIFHRNRPVEINLITERNYSFPSGHAMVSTAFYGYIIYLIMRSSKPLMVKIALVSLLIFLIILIALSRVYLGVHYFSDVVAGVIMSVLYLFIFTKLIGGDNNEK